MEIKKLAEVQDYAAEKMKKISLFSTERVQCDQYCLEPGQAQKPHAHAGEDKLYYIVEGSGKVAVGSEEKAIGAGEIVIAPAGVDHGITNGAGGRMRVLVFMAPNAHFEGGGHGHEKKGHDHGHGHGHGHGHDHGHKHGHGGGCGC
ncbi:MAG: cupin domain-containing protein [Nitrospirota bacterium]|nr:cupin domain-containing protein [Nitrospirota bacterium]